MEAAPRTANDEIRVGLPECLAGMRPNLIKITGSLDEADDILQETACRALKAEHLYKPGTNLAGWLWTICRNEFITRRRKDKRAFLCIDDVPEPPIMPMQESQLFIHEVENAIQALPPHARQAITLVCLQGLDPADAAAVMGCMAGTVRSRLWRGRLALAKTLKQENP